MPGIGPQAHCQPWPIKPSGPVFAEPSRQSASKQRTGAPSPMAKTLRPWWALSWWFTKIPRSAARPAPAATSTRGRTPQDSTNSPASMVPPPSCSRAANAGTPPAAGRIPPLRGQCGFPCGCRCGVNLAARIVRSHAPGCFAVLAPSGATLWRSCVVAPWSSLIAASTVGTWRFGAGHEV